MRILRGSSGFTLMEALVGMGLLGAIIAAISTISSHHYESHRRNVLNANLQTLRERAITAVMNQDAWDYTKQHNAFMACAAKVPSECNPTAAPRDFNLYEFAPPAGGVPTPFVNANGAMGFTQDGRACRGFNAENGNASCPIRMRVAWEIACRPGPKGCQYPEEFVSVHFDYAPGGKHQAGLNLRRFNVESFSRRNLALNNSPVHACATRGKVFIGHDRMTRNGTGATFDADEFGCVALTAFKGVRGLQGPIGDQGDRGDRGDKGPRGPPPSGGGDPPVPPCVANPRAPGCPGCANPLSLGCEPPDWCSAAAGSTSAPEICELYKLYLCRYPERDGAVFYNSALQNGVTLRDIEEYMQQVTAGTNIIVTGPDRPQWSAYAQQYGLPYDPAGNVLCQNTDQNCMASSAQAHSAYTQAEQSYCSANPGFCHPSGTPLERCPP